jgi:hypothetical protein
MEPGCLRLAVMLTVTFDRASGNDLLQSNYAHRPSEAQVGAVLVLEPPLELDAVSTVLADRIRTVQT